MVEILAGHRGMCLLKYSGSLLLLVYTSRELFSCLSLEHVFCWTVQQAPAICTKT